MARLVSPYASTAGSNPLATSCARSIDFERLAAGPVKLFITATNVRTGRGRVFRKHEVTPDVLLASACLPTMFQAVEIDGEPYWDGGFSGNPTLTPLVRECNSQDTFLVQINPAERPEPPRSAREIASRMNEVSFNAVLLKELRMIAVLRQVVDAGGGEGARWAGMRMHRIHSDDDGRPRRFLEAQRGVGVPDHAARRGPRAAQAFGGAPRRHRQALDLRPRQPCSKGSEPCGADA